MHWRFIFRNNIECPTYPHFGKVGQIYYNIMVEFHTVVGFVVDFHFSFFISMALLLKGVHHPLVAGRGASPGVFSLELSWNMCWLDLFVCFSSLS